MNNEKRMKFSCLPDDMQTFIFETCEDAFLEDPEYDPEFPLIEIPLSAFPVVPVEDNIGDERVLSDYLTVPFETFPPVIVCRGYGLMDSTVWLDGRHRVATARHHGISPIKAIDLSEFLSMYPEIFNEVASWCIDILIPSNVPTGENA